MYYSTALFEHANLGHVGPYATIGVGVVLVLTTLVSGALMDRAGRRTLHLLGLFGTLLCSLLLTIIFVFTVTISKSLLFGQLFFLFILVLCTMVEISFNCICLYICYMFWYWTWYCSMGYSSGNFCSRCSSSSYKCCGSNELDVKFCCWTYFSTFRSK